MEPWEALDIDDSDLSSFLRPCKRHHLDSPPKTTHAVVATTTTSQSQLIFQHDPQSSPTTLTTSHSQFLLPQLKPTTPTHHLIPGPAGAVQAAMQHRALGHQSLSGDAADPIPTQEFIRRVVENGNNDDHDFNTNAWLCALDWLRREGMVNGNSVAFGTPLSSIKKHFNIERVDQVIAIIKSCAPNGLGDLMVTLKDPSSIVGASVHRKVFTAGEFGKDIKVGSVLILQKVAAFSPTRFVCYLNITSRNIVKIFSEDSEPASELYPTPLRHTAPSTGSNKKVWTLCNTLSLPQERTTGITANATLHISFKGKEDVDKQKGEDKDSGSNHSDNGNNRNQNVVLGKENVSLRQGKHASIAEHVEANPGGELEIEMEDQSNPYRLDGDSPARSAQNNGSSTNLVDISESDGQETGKKNQIEMNREVLIPKGSIPHWTEEQLDELLAFD